MAGLGIMRAQFYEKNMARVYWKQATATGQFGSEQYVTVTNKPDHMEFFSSPARPDKGILVVQEGSRLSACPYTWSTNSLGSPQTISNGFTVTAKYADTARVFAGAFTGRSGHFVLLYPDASSWMNYAVLKDIDEPSTWTTPVPANATHYKDEVLGCYMHGNRGTDDVLSSWTVAVSKSVFMTVGECFRTHDPSGGATALYATTAATADVTVSTWAPRDACSWDRFLYPNGGYVFYCSTTMDLGYIPYTYNSTVFGSATIWAGIRSATNGGPTIKLAHPTPRNGRVGVGKTDYVSGDLKVSYLDRDGARGTIRTASGSVQGGNGEPFGLTYPIDGSGRMVVAYNEVSDPTLFVKYYERDDTLSASNDLPSGGTSNGPYDLRVSRDESCEVGSSGVRPDGRFSITDARNSGTWQRFSLTTPFRADPVYETHEAVGTGRTTAALGVGIADAYDITGTLSPAFTAEIFDGDPGPSSVYSDVYGVDGMRKEFFLRTFFTSSNATGGSLSAELQASNNGIDFDTISTASTTGSTPDVKKLSDSDIAGYELVRIKMTMATAISGKDAYAEVWTNHVHRKPVPISFAGYGMGGITTAYIDIAKTEWSVY